MGLGSSISTPRTPRPGQMTDQLPGGMVDALVDERDQLVAAPAHTQRRVSGIDQFDGGMNDGAQGVIELQAGGDHQHGVDKPIEPIAALDDLSDPILDFDEQLTQTQLRQCVAQRTCAAFRAGSVGHGIIVASVRTMDDGSARLVRRAALS